MVYVYHATHFMTQCTILFCSRRRPILNCGRCGRIYGQKASVLDEVTGALYYFQNQFDIFRLTSSHPHNAIGNLLQFSENLATKRPQMTNINKWQNNIANWIKKNVKDAFSGILIELTIIRFAPSR